MTAERDNFSEHLTFSQRYGYESLPEPMRLEEISEDLRREIWNACHDLLRDGITSDIAGISYYFERRTRELVERTWGRYSRIPENRVETDCGRVMDSFERVITRERHNEVLKLLEIMFGEQEESYQFARKIEMLFNKHAASYCLDTSQQPYQFFPRTSKEQGEAAQSSIRTIREGSMDGAATHLRLAAEHINAGQYAGSIADSMHAVESVARTIDPKSSKTLGPALDSLEKAGVLKHPALKQAFDRLYGYTNTEQGIRHALLDKDAADVGLEEAMFMFGACASFAAYLTEKNRQASGA